MTGQDLPQDENVPPMSELVGGELINFFLYTVPIIFLSSFFMGIAASVLGEKVAWPQIGFMSAYPSDVRNGYLLFVAAVFLTIFISSGLFAAAFGASVGKRLNGIIYVGIEDERNHPERMIKRAFLLLGLLIPIFLLGPALGFVFGPSADGSSLLSLALGTGLFYVFAIYRRKNGVSWVNRTARVKPIRRRHKASLET